MIRCPSRISWLRATVLIFNRIVVVTLFLRFSRSLPSGSIRTLVNIGGWIGFSLLMGVWSHFVFVFKGQTKLWKIQTKSVAEAVDALKISFLSDLIAIGSGIFFAILGYILKLNDKIKEPEVFLGGIVLLMLVVWFFSIPLLYEKALVARESKAKSKVKPKSKLGKK